MTAGRILVRGVSVVAPKMLGGGLTLVLGLAMAATVEPAVYGRYVYAVTLVILADAVLGASFDLATVRLAQGALRAAPERALAIERQSFLFKTLGSLAVAAAVLLAAAAAPGLAGPLAGDHVLAGAILGATLGLLAVRSMLLHLQMRERFGAYGRLELAHAALRFVPAFALLAVGETSPQAVVLALAAGSLAATAFALRGACRPLATLPVRPAEWGAILRAAGWYVVTLAIGATLSRLDVLMLAPMVAAEALGAYGAATVVASVPALLGVYLSVLLTPQIVARAAAGTLRRLMIGVQAALWAVAAALGLAAVLAWPLIAGLPGSMGSAAPILAILLPGALIALITTPLALPFVMLARPRFMLCIDVVVAPLAVLTYLAAIRWAGVEGAAWTTLAVTLVRSGAVLVAAWRLSARQHDFGRDAQSAGITPSGPPAPPTR